MHPYDSPLIGIEGSFPLQPSFPSVWVTLDMVHIMVDGRCPGSGLGGKALGTYPTTLTLLGMLLEVFQSKVLIPTLRGLGSILRFQLPFSAHLGFERSLQIPQMHQSTRRKVCQRYSSRYSLGGVMTDLGLESAICWCMGITSAIWGMSGNCTWLGMQMGWSAGMVGCIQDRCVNFCVDSEWHSGREVG